MTILIENSPGTLLLLLFDQIYCYRDNLAVTGYWYGHVPSISIKFYALDSFAVMVFVVGQSRSYLNKNPVFCHWL